MAAEKAKRFEWVKRESDGALCLSGHPIRVMPGSNGMPWRCIHDGLRDFPYWTLAGAKADGEKWARELDQFAKA